MNVQEILDKKNIEYLEKGGDLLVACFNPEHEDSNPSMRIDKGSGVYHCLSCGYKGNLLKSMGVSHITNNRIDELREKLISLTGVRPVGFPEDAQFNVTEFRGLSADTLDKFDFYRSEEQFPERVAIPLRDASDNIVCSIARLEYSDAKPKYIIKPKNTPAPLTPNALRCNFNTRTLVFVEGPLDAINLHDKGMDNAVATMGTKTLNKDNILDKLNPYLIAGVQKIIIMYDGDIAGKAGAEYLQKLIKYHTPLVCSIYELPEGLDPGDLTQEQVEVLKDHFTNI